MINIQLFYAGISQEFFSVPALPRVGDTLMIDSRNLKVKDVIFVFMGTDLQHVRIDCDQLTDH